MTKLLLLISLVFSTGLTKTWAQTPVEINGQLRVSGNKIVNKSGDAVQLRGMSLFWSQWQPQFYNSNTVKWLKDDWCISVVRAAMAADVENGGYATSKAIALREKNKVITIVDAAIELGIYVIIDFHSHNAHLATNRAAAKEFFAEMSAKYKDIPNVIYEPWNEPLRNVSWPNIIKPYHIEIIDIIRANDPNNIIVCGTSDWSQRVDQAAYSPIERTNIAYTLHYYADTHKKQLRDIATTALEEGIALFVTEYGTCDASGDSGFNPEESKIWWKFMDDNKISYCNWSIADKVETASAVKPGTDPDGNWAESDLTESGALVKADLIAKCTNPTGIEENGISKSKVLVYPNPFINSINIECAGNFDYSILDLNGKKMSNGTGIQNVTIGEKLPSGIYLIEIKKGEKIELIKVTKNNQ